jgi:hypothetical protein
VRAASLGGDGHLVSIALRTRRVAHLLTRHSGIWPKSSRSGCRGHCFGCVLLASDRPRRQTGPNRWRALSPSSMRLSVSCRDGSLNARARRPVRVGTSAGAPLAGRHDRHGAADRARVVAYLQRTRMPRWTLS